MLLCSVTVFFCGAEICRASADHDLSFDARQGLAFGADIGLLSTRKHCSKLRELLQQEQQDILSEMERLESQREADEAAHYEAITRNVEGTLSRTRRIREAKWVRDNDLNLEQLIISVYRSDVSKDKDSIRMEEQIKDAKIAELEVVLRQCSDMLACQNNILGNISRDLRAAQELKIMEENRLVDDEDAERLQGLDARVNDAQKGLDAETDDAKKPDLEAARDAIMEERQRLLEEIGDKKDARESEKQSRWDADAAYLDQKMDEWENRVPDEILDGLIELEQDANAEAQRLEAEKAQLESEVVALERGFSDFLNLANEGIRDNENEIEKREQKIQRIEGEFKRLEKDIGNGVEAAEIEIVEQQVKYNAGFVALSSLLISHSERLVLVGDRLTQVDARMDALEAERRNETARDLADFPKRIFMLCRDDEETTRDNFIPLVKEYALKRKLEEIDELLEGWRLSLDTYGKGHAEGDLDVYCDGVYRSLVAIYKSVVGRFCGKTGGLGFPKFKGSKKGIRRFLEDLKASGLRSRIVWDDEKIDGYRNARYLDAASELLGLRSSMEGEQANALKNELRTLFDSFRELVAGQAGSSSREGGVGKEVLSLHKLILKRKKELKEMRQGVCLSSEKWDYFVERAASVRAYRLLDWESDAFLGGLESLLILFMEHMQERHGIQDYKSLLIKDLDASKRMEKCLQKLKRALHSYGASAEASESDEVGFN